MKTTRQPPHPPDTPLPKDSMQGLDVKWGGLHIDLRVALLKLKSPMIAATLLRNKNEIF